jgi:hypothetical protein
VLRALLKHVLQSLIITAIFVPMAMTLPVAAIWLCQSPEGGQFLFWLGPWSCCFWALILHNFVGSRFWRGREAVLAWRAERGGYVWSVGKSTGVMFASLFLSYVIEFGYVYWLHTVPGALRLLPVATYAPAAFVLWRAIRG